MSVNRRILSCFVVVALLLVVAGCDADWVDIFGSSNNNNDSNRDNTSVVADTDVAGLAVAVSDNNFTATQQALVTAVDNRQSSIGAPQALAIALQTQANSALNASNGNGGVLPGNTMTGTGGNNANLNVRPTQVLLYSNPSQGTPILNADPRAGLDLPPALLVYQDSENSVGVAYDSAAYYRARYDVADADDALDALQQDARSLAEAAAGSDVSVDGDADDIRRGQGIVSRDSNDDFNTTLARLINAIGDDNSLELITQVDQRQAALGAGLMLGNNDNQSTLVLFDGGANSARLLASGQTLGIDLPLRMLVSEADNGDVTVYYNAPDYLATRHQIDNRDNARDDLADTLSDLADVATGN